MRAEAASLELTVAAMGEQVAAHGRQLTAQVDALLTSGDAAAGRLASLGQVMASEIALADRHTASLVAAARQAETSVGTVLNDLPRARAETEESARVLAQAGREAADSATALDAQVTALADRGLTRVLCEGGPSLLAALARAGVADELDLTVSPVLVGPDVARIVGGAAWSGDPLPLRLHSLLEEDGALFARYRRTG